MPAAACTGVAVAADWTSHAPVEIEGWEQVALPYMKPCSLLDFAMRPPTLVAAVEHEEEGGSRLPGSEEEADPHGATPGRRTPPARLALLSSIWCRFRDE